MVLRQPEGNQEARFTQPREPALSKNGEGSRKEKCSHEVPIVLIVVIGVSAPSILVALRPAPYGIAASPSPLVDGDARSVRRRGTRAAALSTTAPPFATFAAAAAAAAVPVSLDAWQGRVGAALALRTEARKIHMLLLKDTLRFHEGQYQHVNQHISNSRKYMNLTTVLSIVTRSMSYMYMVHHGFF